MLGKNQKSLAIRRMALFAVVGFVSAAHGQEEGNISRGASTATIEEIIVTAQKRSQSMQDIGASISAIGAKELDLRGIRGMDDLQFAVPSLHFSQVLGNQDIAIRGVGSFQRQPGVAVSLDGIYQTRTTASQLYQLDLERVEVLRGPQGTLYGRNSNGGVVNYITAAPTDEYEGFVRLGYAEFDEARIQGVFSGPISDRVAFRISAEHIDRGDGWVENQVPGKDDPMQGELSSARIKLAAELTDTISVDLMYAKGKIEGPMDHFAFLTDNRDLATGMPQLADADFTLEPNKVYADADSDSDRDYDLYGLTFEWDLGFATLRSITAQQDFNDDSSYDRDATNLYLLHASDDSNTDAFTQELNLIGSNETFDWVLGAYYMDEKWDRRVIFQSGEPIQGFPFPIQFDFNQTTYETESVSVFFDGTWNITDRARISAGIRSTEDDISEYHVNTLSGFIPDPTPLATLCDQVTEEDFSDTTGRAMGQYDISDNGNIYLSYSQGYKAGGVTQFECTPAYKPETIDAYELGYKSSFNGGRTTLTMAAFYYDYTDFQLLQVVGTNTVTVNAGDAEITGAEMELSTLIGENLSLSGGLTLLDSEYKEFLNTDSMMPELGEQSVEGNSLNNAPDTSLNLGIAYSTSVPSGGQVTLRADAAYRSRTYYREFNEKDDSQGSYTVVNLNAVWTNEDGGWEARVFAKNVTDEEYITGLIGSATNGGRFGTWGMPRQVGVELTMRFGNH
jgi:iron complex outermembrane receptor protein